MKCTNLVGEARVGEAIWPGDGDRVGEEKIYWGGEFGAGVPSPPNPNFINWYGNPTANLTLLWNPTRFTISLNLSSEFGRASAYPARIRLEDSTDIPSAN